MGTDHAILVGWGYRIPVSEWSAFKKALQEKSRQTKRHCREGDDSWDEYDLNANWLISDFEGHNEVPKTHGFVSQGLTTKEDDEASPKSYVLIYHRSSVEHLMDRKVGGSLAWTCSHFDHMQNISTLSFSVQLEWDWDWHLVTDETLELPEGELSRRDLICGLPDHLREFIVSLSPKHYYNRWLFSYAW